MNGVITVTARGSAKRRRRSTMRFGLIFLFGFLLLQPASLRAQTADDFRKQGIQSLTESKSDHAAVVTADTQLVGNAPPAAAKLEKPSEAAPRKKFAIPSDDAQRSAQKIVADTYKAELAKTNAEDKAKFAQLLIKQADDSTGDPVGPYVLLKQ